MRPELQNPTTNTTAGATAGGSGLQQWNTPIPYLFGGVALMLGVIALALMFLACSNKNSSETSNEEAQKPMHELRPEMEPRIVVIMAGETNPTYLAKPLAATPRREEV